MSRWRFLALERPRRKARFRWRDRLFCSLGLALGIFFLVLSWGFVSPLEELVRTKILGTMPDRLRVTAKAVTLGPVAMGATLSQQKLAEVEQVQGVKAVYRQAHFGEPCQLTAAYAGESLITDLVLEIVDPEQVAHEVADGYSFSDPGPEGDIPAVVPRAILDLVNSGISVNTNLPQLSVDALIGKHFTLHLGTSSFRKGPSRPVRCVVVGISDQIGAGGPAIPFAAAQRLSQEEPLLHTLTVQLESPELSATVVPRLDQLGLHAPRLEMAEKVSTLASLLRFFGVLLPLAILLVTGLGLAAVLELQVTRERQLIALYRSLGATSTQVGQLYLIRCLSVAVTGFVLGCLGGLVGGQATAVFLEGYLPPDLLQGFHLFSPPLATFGWGLFFSLGLTVLAGWLPARQASKVAPAQVFREPG